MICPNCGEEQVDNSRFCCACGIALKTGGTDWVPDAVTSDSAHRSTDTMLLRSDKYELIRKMVIIAMLIVTLFTACATGFEAVNGRNVHNYNTGYSYIGPEIGRWTIWEIAIKDTQIQDLHSFGVFSIRTHALLIIVGISISILEIIYELKIRLRKVRLIGLIGMSIALLSSVVIAFVTWVSGSTSSHIEYQMLWGLNCIIGGAATSCVLLLIARRMEPELTMQTKEK